MNFYIKTQGHGDVINITDKIEELVRKENFENGIVLVFTPHSTVAITTMEYEEGVKKDLIEVLEKIAPENKDYKHHKKWGDKNGSAHIKSALIGTSFTIPVENNKLSLGTWQQLVLIDFDERARERKVVIKLLTES